MFAIKKSKDPFSVTAETTCSYLFTKEINYASTCSQHFNSNSYSEICLRVVLTGKPALSRL